MIFGVRSIHIFVVWGLSLSAVALGFLSVTVDIDAPRREDHPYRATQIDGCYQIFDHAHLDRPGCYVLRNDVLVKEASKEFLSVDSDDVDLDLNGKTVTGTGATSTRAGIYVAGGDRIIIRNGTIKDFLFGIRGETGPNGDRLEQIAIEDVNVVDASNIGIKLDAADVSLIDVKVESLKDSTDDRRPYLFDISIDATRCLYSQIGGRVNYQTDATSSPIRLPADCRKID